MMYSTQKVQHYSLHIPHSIQDVKSNEKTHDRQIYSAKISHVCALSQCLTSTLCGPTRKLLLIYQPGITWNGNKTSLNIYSKHKIKWNANILYNVTFALIRVTNCRNENCMAEFMSWNENIFHKYWCYFTVFKQVTLT